LKRRNSKIKKDKLRFETAIQLDRRFFDQLDVGICRADNPVPDDGIACEVKGWKALSKARDTSQIRLA
jgi:hypothetical protein